MRRWEFVIAIIGFVAAATWALTTGGAGAWIAALILFTVAVFLSPWVPDAGDNHDSISEGGSGV